MTKNYVHIGPVRFILNCMELLCSIKFLICMLPMFLYSDFDCSGTYAAVLAGNETVVREEDTI